MIGVIGSRIIPLFTRNALLKKGVKVTIATRPWLDGASLAVLVAVIIVDLARPESRPAGAVAALAAVLLAARLAHWHAHRALRMPIVWILHAGYAWLVASLALKAAWLLGGAVWGFYWLHALTAGAFGTMVLGVMTRVALGHSGRPLEVATPIVIAYFLVIAGAVLRVAVPALLPSYYFAVLVAAASCWATGFAIFVFIYAPILVAPRANRA
jgi:uncharacterized protein involved in response to NO